MIQTNWHTHTKRCGHAIGEDEEYVLAAIRAGFKTLGFSDHAAYPKSKPSERMNVNQVEDYIKSITKLKEKYKNQINIYLGMEVECYRDQWETLSKYRKQFDYCILGQHNLDIDQNSSYNITTSDQLETYVNRIEYACDHHLADYICHPDVCLWSYPQIDDSVRQAARRLADISLHYNIPLELNCGSGVRVGQKEYKDGYRYAYPTRVFFEEFANKQCPIIIGLDIHDPSLFLTDKYLNRALEVVEGLDINFLTDYNLVAQAKENKKLFY